MLKHFSQLVSTPVLNLLFIDSEIIFNLYGVIKMFWKLMNYNIKLFCFMQWIKGTVNEHFFQVEKLD